MVHWEAEIKERGRDGILKPSYSIPDAEKENYDRSFFVKFWGLDQPDVEWYKLRCEEE